MNKAALYGELNTLNLNLLIALSRTTQSAHRRSSEIFKVEGLTSGQFAVLEALYHKGPLTVNQIIESVLSTGGNITVVINNLEKDKMITRSENPDDKRSVLISITEKGRERIQNIFPIHMDDLSDYFGSLEKEEKEQLILLLKKIKKGK